MLPGLQGIVRPACPRCHRIVRIDKPLDGMRVCRTCIAHSRIEECVRCAARREPVTRDDRGRPLCANCFLTDPANTGDLCPLWSPPASRASAPQGPLYFSLCPTLPSLTCSICGETTPCGISRATGHPWCPACQRRSATPARHAGEPLIDRLRHPDPPALRRLHHARGLARLPHLRRSRPTQTRASAPAV